MVAFSVVDLVRDGSAHGGAVKHVFLTIATYADRGDGTGIHVSIPTLVAVTGLGERTVYDAIRRLVVCGELLRDTGRGRGHTNGYAINLAALRENLRRRRAEAAAQNLQNQQQAQGLDAQNLQPAAENVQGAVIEGAGDAPFEPQNLQENLQPAAENLQSPSAKPATAAPHRVRSDRVTGDDGPDSPRGDRTRARATNGTAKTMVAPLAAAFAERGLPPPALVSSDERHAAEVLLKLHPPAELAGCWAAYAGGDYGDELDRRNLSFVYLSRFNRVANWKRETARGKEVNGHGHARAGRRNGGYDAKAY